MTREPASISRPCWGLNRHHGSLPGLAQRVARIERRLDLIDQPEPATGIKTAAPAEGPGLPRYARFTESRATRLSTRGFANPTKTGAVSRACRQLRP